MYKQYVIILIALLATGCTRYNVSNIDKPPPKEYQSWHKAGATEIDIKKALLECGAPAPHSTDHTYSAAGIKGNQKIMNHHYLTSSCMEQAGYSHAWWGRTVQASCTDINFPDRKNFPACQLGVEIPKPSIERRLNSWHCKIKTDYSYCLEHAVNPSACNPDGFKNPPPECLAPGQTPPPANDKTNQMIKRSSDDFSLIEYPDKTLQLQRDMQNQNNQQMNQMLRNISR